MNRDIVGRAVRHFESRCGSELFCRTALECTDDGEAYFDETKKMVHSIVDRIRKRQTEPPVKATSS
jgi:DNA-binding transcriptional LysR family regulator